MLSSQKYYSRIITLKISLKCHLIITQLLTKISPDTWLLGCFQKILESDGTTVVWGVTEDPETLRIAVECSSRHYCCCSTKRRGTYKHYRRGVPDGNANAVSAVNVVTNPAKLNNTDSPSPPATSERLNCQADQLEGEPCLVVPALLVTNSRRTVIHNNYRSEGQ